jgi:hypothetical protein
VNRLASIVRRPRRVCDGHALYAAIPLVSLLLTSPMVQATPVQDEIYGDNYEGFDLSTCDDGLASDSTDAAQFAQALDLCQATTESSHAPGLISAALTLTSGTGTTAAVSHAIRQAFGSGNAPRMGSAMAVLSTGSAAAVGQVNPSFVAFQPGDVLPTSSAAPSDWLSANGNVIPTAPGCPAPSNTTAFDPVMLTLRVRVPNNARSFSLDANFFSSEFPEFVCSTTNDVFVALLDSTFAGIPANPADKNLANYIAPSLAKYPLGVNLARDATGLFTQCVIGNTNTGCSGGTAGTITTCTGTAGLSGTGMDTADASACQAGDMVGGGTGWLVLRGNVVPGETIQLRLAIWDTGDHFYDSLILLDHLQWSFNNVTPGTTLN